MSADTPRLPATFNRLAWSNLAAQSAEQIALARQLIEDGQKPRAVAQVLKVHPATLYRCLANLDTVKA